MADSNLERARRGFEEYNRAGPSGVIEYMVELDAVHPDFLFFVDDELPTAGTYRGIEGYTKVTTEWEEAWSSFKIRPKELVEVDEDVILVAVEQDAVAKGSGLELTADFFYVLVFKDGKLEQMRLYADRASADAAIEEAEA